MVELFFRVGNIWGKAECPKVQLGRWRLDTRRKKCHSEGSTLGQQVTLRESGSAQGFVFQGTARCKGKVKVSKMLR